MVTVPATKTRAGRTPSPSPSPTPAAATLSRPLPLPGGGGGGGGGPPKIGHSSSPSPSTNRHRRLEQQPQQHGTPCDPGFGPVKALSSQSSQGVSHGLEACASRSWSPSPIRPPSSGSVSGSLIARPLPLPLPLPPPLPFRSASASPSPPPPTLASLPMPMDLSPPKSANQEKSPGTSQPPRAPTLAHVLSRPPSVPVPVPTPSDSPESKLEQQLTRLNINANPASHSTTNGIAPQHTPPPPPPPLSFGSSASMKKSYSTTQLSGMSQLPLKAGTQFQMSRARTFSATNVHTTNPIAHPIPLLPLPQRSAFAPVKLPPTFGTSISPVNPAASSHTLPVKTEANASPEQQDTNTMPFSNPLPQRHHRAASTSLPAPPVLFPRPIAIGHHRHHPAGDAGTTSTGGASLPFVRYTPPTNGRNTPTGIAALTNLKNIANHQRATAATARASNDTVGVLTRNLPKSDGSFHDNGDVSMSPAAVRKPVPRVNLSSLKLPTSSSSSSSRLGLSPRRTRSHTGRLADMAASRNSSSSEEEGADEVVGVGSGGGRTRSPSSPAAPLSPPLNSDADVKRTVNQFDLLLKAGSLVKSRSPDHRRRSRYSRASTSSRGGGFGAGGSGKGVAKRRFASLSPPGTPRAVHARRREAAPAADDLMSPMPSAAAVRRRRGPSVISPRVPSDRVAFYGGANGVGFDSRSRSRSPEDTNRCMPCARDFPTRAALRDHRHRWHRFDEELGWNSPKAKSAREVPMPPTSGEEHARDAHHQHQHHHRQPPFPRRYQAAQHARHLPHRAGGGGGGSFHSETVASRQRAMSDVGRIRPGGAGAGARGSRGAVGGEPYAKPLAVLSRRRRTDAIMTRAKTKRSRAASDADTSFRQVDEPYEIDEAVGPRRRRVSRRTVSKLSPSGELFVRQPGIDAVSASAATPTPDDHRVKTEHSGEHTRSFSATDSTRDLSHSRALGQGQSNVIPPSAGGALLTPLPTFPSAQFSTAASNLSTLASFDTSSGATSTNGSSSTGGGATASSSSGAGATASGFVMRARVPNPKYNKYGAAFVSGTAAHHHGGGIGVGAPPPMPPKASASFNLAPMRPHATSDPVVPNDNHLRRFKCSSCDKRFTRKGNMQRHEITHSNAKPYHCRVCGRGFNDPSNKRKHEKNKHHLMDDDL